MATNGNNDNPSISGASAESDAIAVADLGKGDVQIAAKNDVVSVARPEAGKEIAATVVPGQQLKLSFNNADVVRRELNGDDLVLQFRDGGKVVLKDYLVAFGMAGDLATEVVQANGAKLAISALLTPAAGQLTEPQIVQPVGQGTVLEMPRQGEIKTITLMRGKPIKMNFLVEDVVNATAQGRDLVLDFGNGGKLVLKGYADLLNAAPDTVVTMPNGNPTALIALNLSAAGPQGENDDAHAYRPYDPGALGPGIDHLGPLPDEDLRFGVPDPIQRTLFVQFDGFSSGINSGPPDANPDGFGDPNAAPDFLLIEEPAPVPFAAFAAVEPEVQAIGVPGPSDARIIEVLANDTDPDGDALTITHINGVPVTIGMHITTAGGNDVELIASLLGDPDKLNAVVFDPAGGFSGTDSFTYTITDGNNGSATTTVFVNMPVTNEWQVTGDTDVTEGTTADYVIAFSGDALTAGQTRSITVNLTFPGGPPNPASNADFAQTLAQALDDAIAAQAPGSITRVGNTLTFSSSAPPFLSIALPTTLDGVAEGDERFVISLSGPAATGGAAAGVVNPALDDVATLIHDPAVIPAVWHLTGAANVNEGSAASYTLSYTGAVLNGSQTVSIDLAATLPGGFGGASASDFLNSFFADVDAGLVAGITRAGSTITFAAGAATSINFSLPTLDDFLAEGPETYTVVISNPTNGSAIQPGQASVLTTIVDNEPNQWSLTGDAGVAEGNAAQYILTFNGPVPPAGASITLTANLPGGVGGASAPDFSNAFLTDVQNAINGLPPGHGVTLVGNVLRFTNPAVTSLVFNLPTVGDVILEGNETYGVVISAPSTGAISGSPTVTTTIVDDDAAAVRWDLSGPATVNEGAGAAYNVSYSGVTLAAGQTVSINLAASLPGGAGGASNADFLQAFLTDVQAAINVLPAPQRPTLVGSTLTFGSTSNTSLTFTLNTADDNVFEGPENYTISINTPSSGSIANNSVATTIVDNDGANIQWTLTGDQTVIEGGSAGYSVGFGGAVLGAGQSVSVSLGLAFGTASAPDLSQQLLTAVQNAINALPPGHGISLAGSTLTFSNPAVTSLNFSIPTFDDALVEGPEDYTITISAPSVGSVVGGGNVTTTIIDNDSTPTSNNAFISINDVIVDETAGTATFIVTRSGKLSGASSVNFTTADGTALAGQDYTGTNGSLNFAAGQATASVTVAITNDLTTEGNEQFSVNLSAPSGAVLGDASGTGTIVDNDGPGAPATRVGINDVTVNESAGTATFTITRYGDSSGSTTVNFGTADGSATGGSDYSSTAGTVTFGAGVTQLTVSVAINDDGSLEGNESFSVNLTGASGGAAIIDATGVGTIVDNDAQPTSSIFAIGDVTVNEGAGTATFVVVRTGNVAGAASVNFGTADGSATGGLDFGVTSGTLLFNAGVTQQTITVSITDDLLAEQAETFLVNLNSPVGGTVADATGVGTILDNDTTGTGGNTPLVIINDRVVDEAAGTVTFTVTRIGDLTGSSTVNFATGDGTATAGSGDYASTAGTLIFGLGQATASITVAISDDLSIEGPENFFVNLTSGSNATVVDPQGQATIVDNDTVGGAATRLYVNDVTVNEDAGTMTFTVMRLGTVSGATTVNFATADGSALAGSDYGSTAGVLSFAAGVTQQTITVAVVNDAIDEAAESFSVNLSNATGGTVVDPTGVGTILDNDAPVQGATEISIGSVTVNEGAGTATFIVTRTGNTTGSSTANFITSDASATAGSDYTATAGVVSFGAGVTQQIITVAITDDALVEQTETFLVSLTTPTGATISNNTGVGTIIDNDTTAQTFTPQLIINDRVVDEAAGTVTFTVTRLGDLSAGSSVNFATGDGSAAAGQDYTATGGTLNFAAGQATASITVAITDDALAENPESFFVNLSGATNATVVDPQGQATIQDNDGTNGGGARLFINDVTVDEAAGTAVFAVTRQGDLSGATTSLFSTADGTAQAGQDYAPTAGLVSFAAGVSQVLVTVGIVNDALDEGAESFSVNLSNASGGTIADGTGVGTILDNDSPSQHSTELNIGSVTVNENAGTATFVVTRTGDTTGASTALFATADGTAIAGADYTATAGLVSFGAGVTQMTISVAVADDAIVESTESFLLNLTSPTGATISNNTGIGTIVDNDSTPQNFVPMVIINDRVVDEAAGTVTFTVTRLGDLSNGSTVNFNTSDGTANAGQDYTGTAGSLVFAAGQATASITVAIADDALDESSETFNVNLTGITNANVIDNQGVGTILDNDPGAPGTPRLFINDVSVNENAGTMTFTVTRTGDTSGATSVLFATADGTALAGADYGSTAGALTFAAGVTQQTITVSVT
ncbi:MAG: Calx-beta domain-containing protein, partial [Alphaproteobacteria bacterium]